MPASHYAPHHSILFYSPRPARHAYGPFLSSSLAHTHTYPSSSTASRIPHSTFLNSFRAIRIPSPLPLQQPRSRPVHASRLLLFAADHCVYRIPSMSVPVAPSSPNVVACLELTPASLLHHTPSPRIMSIPARTRSCLYVRPQGCSLLHDRGLRARVRPGSHVRILAPIIPPRMSHPDSHCGPASMIPR